MFTSNLFYNGNGLDQILDWKTDDEEILPGRDAYYTIDSSLNYTSSWGVPKGYMWHLRLWCNNVFDNDALSYRSYSDTMWGNYWFRPGEGTVSGAQINPRTYGAAFGIDW
jgi:hypothetical protein